MSGRHCITGKIRYRTRGFAFAAQSRIGNAGLAVYHCKACADWHLGNSRDPVMQQARIDQLLAPRPPVAPKGPGR